MPHKERDAIQLCLGQVRHKRLRPVRNAFSYGVFYLRVPVHALAAGVPALRWFSRNRLNLLSFHDADHGDGAQPLHAWIGGLLQRHGVHDADGAVWLQTMPRVLGYLFNPVSFWFCHRADGSLRAVLCDVRNTFGERHLYLLENGGAIANGALLQAEKAFHVSPFLPLRGSYRFRFVRAQRGAEPGAGGDRHLACIDYLDGPELALSTSISGTAQPLSDGAVLRACAMHPLLTLAVMARIHWQALRLWCKRTPFFTKPAAPNEDLSK
ncbi:hypothetical protein ASD15_24090 [Massilia sp. Root351]|jgi:DUF1365 family protein|uniref:DUF1365 domain-containing protein n=1 Tax=Massilia sp. Root351 TaxID=1736522 RepID=UPI000710F124|nr:DUF1365 domain-containing protein [Massilia sp. Root351]KQV90382.1 hypothetical protein ASD15_24090 [Massilia sp. Root351]